MPRKFTRNCTAATNTRSSASFERGPSIRSSRRRQACRRRVGPRRLPRRVSQSVAEYFASITSGFAVETSDEGVGARDRAMERLDPRCRSSAALAPEQRTDVRENAIAEIEYRLKRARPENRDGERPREPSAIRQTSEYLGDRFASDFHPTVRHDEVNRRVRVPDIEIRIDRSKRDRIVPDRSYDETSSAGWPPRRRHDPARDRSADRALAVEEQNRFDRCGGRRSVHERNGPAIAVMSASLVGSGPTERPTSIESRNMTSVGVPSMP